ncbi:hypothetical protein WOLCODRAFT_109609 [Wolfiporia cocos MD-104 SS10]|uniref:S-adenosyl-L-methionine-dependent methyltransferase n=1 Tax=Wolfiporia cocos (strain MD-104) TaxID=742152 RepID=A0A2H3J4F3_WOLCO|nr:hypothetical protein WOLCODRAFT_109609 [Wolfiporia cocos MD-104 SS10]
MRVSLNAPTSQLPPIGKIQHYPTEELTRALCYLRHIYNPEVRGIRRIHSKKTPNAIGAAPSTKSPTKHSSEDSGLDTLRSDSFERSYAIRWLTALVSKVQLSLDDQNDEADAAAEEALIQQAASLLAICAGAASAGALTRVFLFQHANGPIQVQLTDVPLENQDYASVGAQTWGSACLLAEMLAEAPEEFGLDRVREEGLRALELGAGTGLASVTLAKVLEAQAGAAASVVATDFHPSVLANLRNNIKANTAKSQSVTLFSHFLDWSQLAAMQTPPSPPFDEGFDVIVGADIIYETDHARWIKSCVEQLLRKPNANKSSQYPARFHLVIPLRPTHTLESNAIEEVFPRSSTLADLCESTNEAQPVLAMLSKDVIVCEADGDVGSRCGSGNEMTSLSLGWLLVHRRGPDC